MVGNVVLQGTWECQGNRRMSLGIALPLDVLVEQPSNALGAWCLTLDRFFGEAQNERGVVLAQQAVELPHFMADGVSLLLGGGQQPRQTGIARGDLGLRAVGLGPLGEQMSLCGMTIEGDHIVA